MYLEFSFPNTPGGTAAYAYEYLISDLATWSDQHNIAYRKKYIKYCVRVTFDDDTFYSFFAITWNPKYSQYFDYCVIDPMKVDNR